MPAAGVLTNGDLIQVAKQMDEPLLIKDMYKASKAPNPMPYNPEARKDALIDFLKTLPVNDVSDWQGPSDEVAAVLTLKSLQDNLRPAGTLTQQDIDKIVSAVKAATPAPAPASTGTPPPSTTPTGTPTPTTGTSTTPTGTPSTTPTGASSTTPTGTPSTTPTPSGTPAASASAPASSTPAPASAEHHWWDKVKHGRWGNRKLY